MPRFVVLFNDHLQLHFCRFILADGGIVNIPNLEQAVIEPAKITKYLLSQENSAGKSIFFATFGFTLSNW